MPVGAADKLADTSPGRVAGGNEEETHAMTPTDHGAPAGQRGEGKATSSTPRNRTSESGSGSGTDSGGSGSREREHPAGSSTSGSARASSSTGPSSGSESDRVRVLIGPSPQPWSLGLAVPDLDGFAQALEAEPDVTFLRRIEARPPRRTLGGVDAGGPALIAAELPVARASVLQRHLQLVAEPDAPLEPASSGYGLEALASAPAGSFAGLVAPFYGAPLSIAVTVTDPGGQPVEGALVCAFARRGPALGLTDPKGRAELELLDQSPESLWGLGVAPARDHWGRWIPEPRLDPSGANTVVVERLDGTFPGFPDQELVGWGLRAMRIDQLPPTMRGKGAKIAFVDSGAATGAHPDLRSPAAGFDLIAGNATAWKDDVLAHGTHCLGIVAGSRSGAGIRGIAPEADVVVLKMLPGGRCSTLIEAIDRCIEEEVDVINLGLCSSRPSALVEQRLQQARQLGIACIAAAGNTAGPVAYPASSPAVLAVAAVGRLGEFPPDSPHAAQPAPGVPIGPDGFFAARLSAHGWEIDVCGPGVAIVSTVPPDRYAAWDGTSAAAAHVSGLAALLVAHHPDFAGAFRARTAARVDRLFDMLRRSARPLALGDTRRTGAGLPDALVAFRRAVDPSAMWSPLGAMWSPGAMSSGGPTIDLTVPLDQLATVMQQAGIVNGNGGSGNGKGGGAAEGNGGSGRSATDAALAQLRETLEQAGIWKER